MNVASVYSGIGRRAPGKTLSFVCDSDQIPAYETKHFWWCQLGMWWNKGCHFVLVVLFCSFFSVMSKLGEGEDCWWFLSIDRSSQVSWTVNKIKNFFLWLVPEVSIWIFSKNGYNLSIWMSSSKTSTRLGIKTRWIPVKQWLDPGRVGNCLVAGMHKRLREDLGMCSN